MHLADVIALRSVPTAGLIIEVTRRCPLSCAHCSTASTMALKETASDDALALVNTFTEADRPALLALTGGEPFLRPGFIQKLTQSAHSVGTKVHVLTGAYFATRRIVPPPIRRALEEVDHIAVSIDAFHEREVPRESTFRLLSQLIALRKDVSCQIVGMDNDDPYLKEVVDDVRQRFQDQVPMLVSAVRPVGRARSWMPADPSPGPKPADPSPCTMAAWPVVCVDGRITACCNQSVVNGIEAPHLRLGHASTDSWNQVRARSQGSNVLKALRTCGPIFLTDALGVETDGSYCGSCLLLGKQPELEARVVSQLRPALLEIMDRQVAESQRSAGAVAFATRFGIPEHAPLVALGFEGSQV